VFFAPPTSPRIFRGRSLERLLVNFALPVLFFIVLYVVLILPQGRRRRQAAALQRAVEPGSQVVLTSGLYGTVVEIEDDAIVIEAAEGVHLRFAKAAVLRVIPEPVDTDEMDDDEDGDADYDDADHHGGHDDADDAQSDVKPVDDVARPSNREDHQGNDAGSGPVPQA
jgi:preprotein translocase subunit YajC